MTLGGREGSPPIRSGRPHVQRTGRHVTKGPWTAGGCLRPRPMDAKRHVGSDEGKKDEATAV